MSNKKKKHEYIENPIGISLDQHWQDDEDRSWYESLPAKEYNSDSEHPTPEQLLLRHALQTLTPKQSSIWEMWAYDRLTQDEIAKKLKMQQPNVARDIKTIERKITSYVNANRGAYELLKQDYRHID